MNHNNNPVNAVEKGSSNLLVRQGEMLPQENLVHVIMRHRGIILLAVALFLSAAFFYLLKATPIYTSSSRLYVEQMGPKIISEYEGVMTRSMNYLYTQGELIRSTPIIADAVDDLRAKRLRTLTGIDNPTGYLKKQLRVQIGKTDDLITVSIDSPYPEEAAQIVMAVVDSYVEYHQVSKRSTTYKVLDILRREKERRDQELSQKFDELLRFTNEHGVVSFENKGEHVIFQRLAKLSEALTEAELATVEAKAGYEAVLSMAAEPAKVKQFAAASPSAGVRIFVNDIEMQLSSELKDLEVEMKELRYYCTNEHPSIRAIQTKIAHVRNELDAQAKKFSDAYIEVLRIKWITAKEREKELQASYDAQREAAQDLGVKATKYAVLKSELSRAERACEIIDDRMKDLNVNTEDVGALNINILEVARPARGPSKPQKAKVMGIALVFGLVFGSSLALLRDLMDYRLRSTEEISAVLGVPVLGAVPTMTEVPMISTYGQKLWYELKFILGNARRAIHPTPDVAEGTTGSGGVALPSCGEGKDILDKREVINRGQTVYLKGKSIVAEAYRTVRTAVFFGVPKGEAKTILITSPAQGDGKSTLVSNLAITMAQAGQKTLILDADFRRPVQHNIFDIDNSKGVSDVLAGGIALNKAIRCGPVDGLSILPSGSAVPNPSEILNSEAFSEILKSLSEQYDRVIVDSPPVTPVADSQVLAAICDITVLVLRAEKSTRRHSQQARDGLLSVGGRLLGAVVNDVPHDRGRYGSYGRYGYYGGKGRQSE
jgi:capsular exopolysaccharide synthesis family protein